MITIKELLNKIKWDKRENPDGYRIYYYDRVLDKLIEVKYNDILDIEGLFARIMHNGRKIEIPLHRIKQVRKKGKLIWER